MTEIFLAVCSGALATIAAMLLMLQRHNRRELAALRRALAASSLWWWQADRDSRIVWAQAGRLRPPWLDREQLIGLDFWRIPGSMETQSPPQAIGEAIAAHLPFLNVPITARLAGAGEVVVWLSAVPLHERGGGFRGYVGTATGHDGAPAAEPAAIQERVAQLEREHLERARQFESASREMESFSYSVSHDLRSPLRVVDGFASIILEDYGSRLDELGREHVKRIAGAANRMNAMIDALLAMSRRTGRELEVERVDLSRAARELADELRASDFSRTVEFRIEPDLKADGDPVLLRLVLQNLLGNAFKFSAHAPVALIEFGYHIVDGNDVFFVRDNGAGFDMRFAERLFGLFQRFHSQNEFPGTGVGLATVQRILRKHGGRVWAESEPGKGACFYFTLPAAPAATTSTGA
ncbi:putative Histidine kinase [Burkholderiales bacterium]|nr:putative Histidine kinase [Burkholderiales bacterium]